MNRTLALARINTLIAIFCIGGLTVGCGNKSAVTTPTGNRAPAGIPLHRTCAATLELIRVGATCSENADCMFPQGQCWCGRVRQCGGAYQPPNTTGPRSWQCDKYVSQCNPKDRCEIEGATCTNSSGSKCGDGVSNYICRDSKWVGGGVSPPP
jgi:hypothetical protein